MALFQMDRRIIMPGVKPWGGCDLKISFTLPFFVEMSSDAWEFGGDCSDFFMEEIAGGGMRLGNCGYRTASSLWPKGLFFDLTKKKLDFYICWATVQSSSYFIHIYPGVYDFESELFYNAERSFSLDFSSSGDNSLIVSSNTRYFTRISFYQDFSGFSTITTTGDYDVFGGSSVLTSEKTQGLTASMLSPAFSYTQNYTSSEPNIEIYEVFVDESV